MIIRDENFNIYILIIITIAIYCPVTNTIIITQDYRGETETTKKKMKKVNNKRGIIKNKK
jgi:hypothetical protein